MESGLSAHRDLAAALIANRYLGALAMFEGEKWIVQSKLQPGDRVRIKEGYEDAGLVFTFAGKSVTFDDQYRIMDKHGVKCDILAEAIEPYPYTREERIERAIEDFDAALYGDGDTWTQHDRRALLYAILDAGV